MPSSDTLSSIERELRRPRQGDAGFYALRNRPLDSMGNKRNLLFQKLERQALIFPCSPISVSDPVHGSTTVERCDQWDCPLCGPIKTEMLNAEVQTTLNYHQGKAVCLTLTRTSNPATGQVLGYNGKPIKDSTAEKHVQRLLKFIRESIPLQFPELCIDPSWASVPVEKKKLGCGEEVWMGPGAPQFCASPVSSSGSTGRDAPSSNPSSHCMHDACMHGACVQASARAPYFKSREYHQSGARHQHVAFFGVAYNFDASKFLPSIIEAWQRITRTKSNQIVFQDAYGRFEGYFTKYFSKSFKNVTYKPNEHRYSFSRNAYRRPKVKNLYHVMHKFLPKQMQTTPDDPWHRTPAEWAFNWTGHAKFHQRAHAFAHTDGSFEHRKGCSHPQCRQVLDLTPMRYWYQPPKYLKRFTKQAFKQDSKYQPVLDEMYDDAFATMESYRSLKNVDQYNQLAYSEFMDYVIYRTGDWPSTFADCLDSIPRSSPD